MGGSWFSCRVLPAEDIPVALLPTLAVLGDLHTWRGCGRPGLCFHVCPVSVEAALVCGLASLLPTLPMRSRTVCSPSQACLLLLIPGKQPLPSLGAAYRHSMNDNCWESQPWLEWSHSLQDSSVGEQA